MGNWTAMPTEGGHSDLAPANDLEDAVLKILIEKYGHVSRERVISIPGLIDIWRALAILDGEAGDDLPTSRDIIDRAKAGDERGIKTIALSIGLVRRLRLGRGPDPGRAGRRLSVG
ncbi:MAG: glucokinase [Asticcacaulis sp.]